MNPATLGHPRVRSPILAVAFDLDGTMIETETLFYQIASGMLEERGRQFTDAMMRAMIGRRAVEGLARLKEMAGLEESIEEIRLELRERFLSLESQGVRRRPGLLTVLDRIEEIRLPCCVATSSGVEYAHRMLDRQGLLSRFRFVLTGEEVARGKPDPEMYQVASKRLGFKPDQVLVIEDSSAGVAAGKAAGCHVVAIPHHFSPAEGLAEADLIVPRLDDPGLLALLLPPSAQQASR